MLLRHLKVGWFALLAIMLSVCSLESAEDLNGSTQVKTSISATDVTIGDIVTVRISVRHPESIKIAFPTTEATWGDWIVRAAKQLIPENADRGLIEDVLEMQLTIYKTGEFQIPALSIEVVNPTGQKSTLTSDQAKVSVRSVLTSKDETLKEIKPQADIAPDYKPFLLLLAALASAAYFIYLLVKWLKRRHKPGTALIQDTRTPEEIAREAIRQLLARKLIEDGKFKAFYLELSEIIKRFLGTRLNVPSLERTTREFTRDLRSTDIVEDQYRLIQDFLENCDLVKFAKYRPTAEEVQEAIGQADVIIGATGTKTKPVPKLGRYR